jgi:hypothetical protein
MRRALVLAVVLGGCGDDDSFSPTVENVAGSYSAASFTLTTAQGTVDLLALGSEVTVILSTDGTTTGHLFVPGGGENGEDLDADLAGTWTLSGSTVTFNQTADTFIRDAEFAASQDRLTGEGTFGEETIRLVLTKSE